jgi:hypothetical protein
VEEVRIMRKPVDEVIDYIVSTIDQSITNLPIRITSSNDFGRIDKLIAYSIKSRVLLYAASPLNNPSNDRGLWEKAANAAKDVIDLGVYQLYPDYKTLFTTPFNEEIIWSRQFKNNLSVETRIELHFYPNGSGGYGQVNPLHNLVDAYERTNGLLPSEDPTYDPQNPYADRDPRFYASYLYDGAPWQDRQLDASIPGGLDSSEGAEGWNASYTSYSVRKFVDESIGRPGERNVGNTPWTFIRYGEILLNYAEAMYHLGQEDVAREYVNKIRSRESVKMPLLMQSGTDLLEKIRHERQIELAFEEHRYFDVRRWKIAEQTENEDAKKMTITRDPATGKKTYKVEVFQERGFNPRMYLVPIPQSEIEKNPLLEQNPGY